MKEQHRQRVIEMLTIAYWMEIETVTNYIANSIHLDGGRAEEIKKSLAAELTHAQSLARRVKEVGGRILGSAGFRASQAYLQPRADTTGVVAVIRGVIQAEDAAIAHHNTLIDLCGEATRLCDAGSLHYPACRGRGTPGDVCRVPDGIHNAVA